MMFDIAMPIIRSTHRDPPVHRMGLDRPMKNLMPNRDMTNRHMMNRAMNDRCPVNDPMGG